MNSPVLCSKLTALETKMCGKMMVVITSYFKDELQSIKNDYYGSNWSMHSRALLPYKNWNQNIDLLLMKLARYYPFILQIPVWDNFIQILNVPSKYWVLVFWGKFEQINICDSLVTNGKFPQSLIKSLSHITDFPGLFFNCVFFQFNSKKKSTDYRIFTIAHATHLSL